MKGSVNKNFSLCNQRGGASVRNLCFTSFNEAIGVFEKFRDSGFQTVPPGYRITWENVLATVKENGRNVPCVFKSGNYKGYFGSLTALKNGLTDDKGECEIDNQVNPIAAGFSACGRSKRCKKTSVRRWEI